ncbi:MAG: hypothetical protein H0W72_14790 [Planctomycetes bacterium]|nr:hypothetical protein [Planctomycetota bacterium]
MRALFLLLVLCCVPFAQGANAADGDLAISACDEAGAAIGEPAITADDVETAIVSTAVIGARQERSLRLTMTRVGRDKAREFTKQRLKQPIVVVIAGTVVATPTVVDVSGPDWFLSFPSEHEELVQRFVARIRAR